MTHLAARRLSKWQGVAGRAASLRRHLSRCDSDRKLAPRPAAAAADRCRGRGLEAAGDLRGSLVKRDHKAKWHVSTGSAVSSYLTAVHSCTVSVRKGRAVAYIYVCEYIL